jgi:hypothetical protein
MMHLKAVVAFFIESKFSGAKDLTPFCDLGHLKQFGDVGS